MRYAVLSDVHSNLESLDCALSIVRDDDVVVSLGDSVGYGPNPNECLARLRERVTHAVLGNHDLATLEGFGLQHFNEIARQAVKWTQGVLDGSGRSWLNTLGYELRLPEFLLVHGAPVRYFNYILDKRDATQAFEATDAPLIFVGHTHVAQHWTREPDGSVGHGHAQRGGRLSLEPGRRYIVDVGSVGQPRDLNPDACVVFYDAEGRTVEWIRYAYPIEAVQRKIRDAGLPEHCARRLESGR